ncbi:sepiapterin reductase-like [Argonauta hians]
MASKQEMKDQDVLCVITGASRGLGRTLAVSMAQTFKSSSMFILLARSTNDMDAVKEEMLQLSNLSPDHILPFYFDQGKFDEEAATKLINNIQEHLTKLGRGPNKKFDKYYLFHNAGTLGDISKRCSQFCDINELSSYFNTNVSGMIVLNSKCLQLFGAASKTVVVNISSLAAVYPMSCFGLYCSGKAARDMFFNVLAAEEKEVRVLNYAPGPLDTAMQVEIRNRTWDQQVKREFTELSENSKLIHPEDTVDKLIKILSQDSYTSGDHIDFFD